jgi:hypothetical protein
MINTSSKALEVQWKTQNIKQSPSTKDGTKPDAKVTKKKSEWSNTGAPDLDG